MRLTVEADDGALIARLDGYRPGVLDADRAADLFFDAVLAALQPDQDVDDDTAEVDVVDVEPAEQLLVDRRAALAMLAEGQEVDDVARALGVPVAIVRRWDTDPTLVAS